MDEGLLEKAKAAAQNAYAPYSGIKVGAAVLAASGKVYTGCNVENASYGLTVCAERAAIFNAISRGEKKLDRILIYTDSDKFVNNLPYPCGACLQVMAEFSDDMNIIIANKSGVVKEYSLKELLPFKFGFEK
ncbi:cytidine deaminase [bacterium]|nr:cytidine deaminase [bacterium]